MTPDPITALGALELSRAIHAREVSCAEVMAAYLDRIAALNPHACALVSLRPRAALLAEAAAADAELAAGRDRGWLHGIPQAPKDLTATAGIPTTMGAPALATFVPAAHSILVERTVAAGAILIGKTNTPEFGLGSHTFNPLHGTTANAYAPGRSAGGSSGGAAAALALRLLPVADGSDMMGSLRNPAGWNNVFGFRPSIGRVPSGPTPEVFLQQLSTDGPMGRSVADLAALFATQAGHDPRAPLSLDGDGSTCAGPLEGAVRGTRIGWLGDLGGHLAMDPGVLETCEAALAVFEAMGCVVEPVRVDFDLDALWTAWTTLRSFLVAGSLGPLYDAPATREALKPEAVWEIERGRAFGASAVFRASTLRSAWYRAVLALHARWDVLALPTAQLFPFDALERWPGEVGGRVMDSYHRWMEVVVPASMAGTPTLAVPAGFGPGGLPMGLQLMGPPRADLAVLRLGHAYDLAQAWTRRMP
ncbi:MAG: amidase [Amaricoccus sp.]|uniref:amidase n=1 Tax=Amaricoccus sp. TaxID=1872485 RepID=UPI0039E5A738